MKLKICGVTDLRTLKACDALGVDFVGLVFAKSHRQVSLDQALWLKEQGDLKHAKLVAVFKDMAVEAIEAIIAGLAPDLIQLHDNLSVHFPERATIRAFAYNKIPVKTPLNLLVDALQPGSGNAFDWTCLNALKHHPALWIAGGLRAHNIPLLQRTINPYTADVSSGVETNGKKDIQKITELIKLTREVHHAVQLPRL